MTEAVESEAIVFVVDDDPSMRKALSQPFPVGGLAGRSVRLGAGTVGE